MLSQLIEGNLAFFSPAREKNCPYGEVMKGVRDFGKIFHKIPVVSCKPQELLYFLAKPEGHYSKFIQALCGAECCLCLVLFSDLHLSITTQYVQGGEEP